MKIILLSGGAGKRLWPLSNEILPKQFMKMMNNKQAVPISMLQKTWSVLKEKFGAENLFVAGNSSHEAILREQLGPEARIIYEPTQRDTFAAISLAATFLSSHAGVELDETIVVLPVDTYTDPSYYDCLHSLDKFIQQDVAPLALIGVAPKYPDEKFGYLIPLQSETGEPTHLVQSFYEKPNEQTARELIEQGALWNGGVFAFRLQYIHDLATRLQFPWSFEELYAHYDSIPRISFDYMVVEPEKKIAYVRYDGNWSDLGTWSEIVRVLSPENNGQVIKDDQCDGTYVVNQLGIPIIVADVQDTIISAGPDGILVSSIRTSHAVKPLIEQLVNSNKG